MNDGRKERRGKERKKRGKKGEKKEHENSHKLTFISSNGPHPLFAMDIVEEALNLHFHGKPWYFVLSKSKFYTSKAVDLIYKKAEEMPNELA